MVGLIVAVVLLVAFGSLLGVAEASISRMSHIRALALAEEGHRRAALLERIEADPPRYLNSVYLAVTLVQNGSAILVAIIAEKLWGGLGVAVLSFGFTLVYFVLVEAMSKTFGILNSDRAALATAPLVFALGRILALPTRALIGIANVLLPGKGLSQGPFATEREIRTMADVGHQEGAIQESERELIHSVFEMGDTLVREVMVPRPDVVAVEIGSPIRDAIALGHSRLPVYRGDLDHIEGVVTVRDLLKVLQQGQSTSVVPELLRPAHFVPESKRVADLLREMQQQRFQMALVTDEYGSISGLVTLENLIEELVGDIADEHDIGEPRVVQVTDGTYRVDGRMSIDELNELLGVELPHDGWDTVGGLMLGLLGAVPAGGEEVRTGDFLFKADRMQGRRIAKVVIRRVPAAQAQEPVQPNGSAA